MCAVAAPSFIVRCPAMIEQVNHFCFVERNPNFVASINPCVSILHKSILSELGSGSKRGAAVRHIEHLCHVVERPRVAGGTFRVVYQHWYMRINSRRQLGISSERNTGAVLVLGLMRAMSLGESVNRRSGSASWRVSDRKNAKLASFSSRPIVSKLNL